MFLFFARHFPQLVVSMYDLAIQSAIVYGARKSMSETERHEVEESVKGTIDILTQNLKKDVKRMIGTRSSGRPRKVESESSPKLVGHVLDIARAIMGDQSGEDAVPGLKQIAMAIDPALTEDALGKRLKRAGVPWSEIRTYLAENPVSDTNEK